MRAALICVLLVLALCGASHAFWHSIIYENFEVTEVAWPWSTGERRGLETGWSCLPWLPGPGPLHTWGKETDTIWHVGHPDQTRAIWCAGLPNDLVAGEDSYPENLNSWAVWGPMLITEDMYEPGGIFYFWGNYEPYDEGEGDDFRLLVTDNVDNLGTMEDCCTAFFFEEGSTGGMWWYTTWNFADLDSAGDSVSYMPFYDDEMVLHQRNETYIALYFMSNNIMRGGPPPNPIDYGIVVDDFSIGYDDGIFDFNLYDLRYMDAENIGWEYYELHVDDPIRFRIDFLVRGLDPETEVNHMIYIDDNLDDDIHIWDLPQDTITYQWPTSIDGIFHDTLFAMTYVPQDTGYMSFAVVLDADSLVDEWSDSNNVRIDTVYINQAQIPPWMNYVTFNSEEVIVTEPGTVLNVQFVAYNSSEDEDATISFFYETPPFDSMGAWIPSGYGLPVINGEDSFNWTITNNFINDNTYYLCAQIDDFFFPDQYFYAPYPLVVDFVGVEDNLRTSVPGHFGINKIYPNPFNPTVEVEISVPVAGDLNINWYSIDGRLVYSEELAGVLPGYSRVTWTPVNLSSGIYLVNISSNMGRACGKVLYLK